MRSSTARRASSIGSSTSPRLPQFLPEAAHDDGVVRTVELTIKSVYQIVVSGRLEDVVTTYRLWMATYPDDWAHHNNLSMPPQTKLLGLLYMIVSLRVLAMTAPPVGPPV